MVVLRRDGGGTPTVWCDPCIAKLVDALNTAGLNTEWSCCGHGHQPPMVGLRDGRQVVVLPDTEMAMQVSALFERDVNGVIRNPGGRRP